MKAKVYIHPRCSSCKNGLSLLKTLNVEAQEVSLLEKTPTKTELRAMLKAVGGEKRKLFNTSGKLYREQNIKDQIETMTEAEVVDMLSENAMLIKRPFLIADNTHLIGFSEAKWRSSLVPTKK